MTLKRHVLVCGSAGFVGGHAAAAFRAAGWEVHGAGHEGEVPHGEGVEGIPFFAGELCDAAFVRSVLQRTQPSRIVFAAGPASVEASFADPAADHARQVLPLMQVLDAARQMPDPPGVLLVSSAAVYGNPDAVPVAERAACRPISPYGHHKLQQESLLDEAAAVYGLPTCKARVFSTFGRGLRHLAVWDITRRALAGDYSMEGTAGASRDYLHITDVATALERICRHAPFRGECINVASGAETTIEQLAVMIYQCLGAHERPRSRGEAVTGKPLRWRADIGRLRELGWSQAVPMAQGLRDTVEWIRHHA